MKAQIILVVSLIVAAVTAVSSAAPAAPAAGSPHVTEVVVLDVGANMQKFIELSKRVDAIAAKTQAPGHARYWMSTWGGPDSGHVIIAIEYPSLASLAESVAKMNASPEFAKWLADVQASGIKQLSNSVVTELQP
jgi:hypothetical protein